MTIQKKSLISTLNTTKKATVASSLVAGTTAPAAVKAGVVVNHLAMRAGAKTNRLAMKAGAKTNRLAMRAGRK
jgi:hypothetical protein